MKEIAIQIENLTKRYGDFEAVSDVSFDVEVGEVFGFIGPNGAGKSTVIRTLLGLLQSSGGRCKIFGKEMSLDTPEILAQIGYLPAEVHYYDEMSSRELLEYSAGFYEDTDLSKIDELAAFLELDLTKNISELSSGNKKKCAIIQCLLHNPKLLILDEPTSGLDPLMQNRFFELLEAENKKGVTIFFSSHILSEIQRICHRAAVIKKGKIMTVENIQSLLEKQIKKVEIVFKNKPDRFVHLQGASEIKEINNRLLFNYVGDVNELIDWIAEFDLYDMILKEPDLETIFMGYYER
jgi:ABC-2 type transport system ATP-binding protein